MEIASGITLNDFTQFPFPTGTCRHCGAFPSPPPLTARSWVGGGEQSGAYSAAGLRAVGEEEAKARLSQ